MVLRVQYHNYSYDYVNAATLDRLIASKGIVKFLRPSEDRWVGIEEGSFEPRVPHIRPRKKTAPDILGIAPEHT